MKKRILTLFLALVMCLSLLPAGALAADPLSGTCGGNTRWTLQDNVLTINGTGRMADYENVGSVPWYGQRETITSVLIGADVTSIGNQAFSGCSALTSVSIPNGVTSIGAQAFYQCSSLMGVTIPDSVYSIGNSAFAYCSSLMGVTIPRGMYSVGTGAFQACSRLVAIQVAPENIFYTSVDGVLFARDMDGELTTLLSYPGGKQGSYVIPDSVATVEFGAFSGCSGLTGVTIPGSVTALGASAFSGCTALTEILIPKSVDTIGIGPFAGCTGLTAIQLENGNPSYTTVDGVLFTRDRTALVDYPAGKQGAYTVPNSVTSIGTSAFHSCSSLTGITIPSSVTSIGYAAFWNCTGLKDVYYTGTQYQWNSIKMDEYNQSLTSAAIHYNSTGPVSPVVPSQQPASWAKADVDRAIAENILPAELRSAYGQPATRREFCVLADALYTRVMGSAAPVSPSVTFTDTTDPAVLRMASAGVVQGVGNGAFSPSGQLTREQAATMLARLASALGRPLAAGEPAFVDSGAISTWAREAVGQMQRSGVMAGTGNDMFSPLATYTREQSTVTMMRLYDSIG